MKQTAPENGITEGLDAEQYVEQVVDRAHIEQALERQSNPATALVKSTQELAAYTFDRLAAQKEQGLAILETGFEVMERARAYALRMTNPNDWLLFQQPETGLITGFLSDNGCAKVRQLLRISVEPEGRPRKDVCEDGSFSWTYYGRGSCGFISGLECDGVEGSRAFDPARPPDWLKGCNQAQASSYVRKAAMANLAGSITRRLAGLGSVPLPELVTAWQGTGKRASYCVLGRGFGNREERLAFLAELGGEPPPAPKPQNRPPRRPPADRRGPGRAASTGDRWVDFQATDMGEPVCPECGQVMRLIDESVSAKVTSPFYACANREHRRNLNLDKWNQELDRRAAEAEGLD